MALLSSIKRQDWFLNLSFFIIAAAGLVTVASAKPELFWYQVLWVVSASIIILIFSGVDWRPLINYRWVIVGLYLGSIALLVLNLFLSPVIKGTRGWLALGPLRFQSAELAKVIFLITLAYFFSRRHIGIAHLRNLIPSLVYLMVPVALILLQPDWGTALIFFGIWIGFLLVSGIRPQHLFFGLAIVAVAGFFIWNFNLQSYQKERIIGFFQPNYDLRGINYSVSQSRIAIGSAGWLGKGFRQGTQVQLHFLTEPATDFVLAAWTEEWGLLGAFVILVAFGCMLYRIIRIGLFSRNNFSQFVCLGTAIMFLIQFSLNAGSALGLLPVVGVTFPFFSYGGSSFLTKAVLLGIIQSIATKI